MMNSEIREIVSYFSGDPMLLYVMKEIAKKYYRYGGFKGSLNKNNIDNSEALLSFLGVSRSKWNQTKRLQIKDFINAYNTSRFNEFDFRIILELVDGSELKTKKDINLQQEICWKKYLSQIKDEIPIIYKIVAVSKLKRWFNREISIDELKKIEFALKKLPTEPTRLPVFSYQIFKDPHSLDTGTQLGDLFFDCIYTMKPSGQNKIETYIAVNIIKDDILNFATIRNLVGDSNIFQAAANSQIIWNVPLIQLMNMNRVEPINGNKVFLIENSSVYAIVSDRLKTAPLIMTSGQFKYATWRLLELLPEHVDIYYSSDLDPAGLVMSQKLIDRYPNRVHLFCMSEELFCDKYSFGSMLSDSKASQLKSIGNPKLLSLKRLMEEKKYVLYQEAIIPEMIQTIEKYLNY